MRRDGDPSASDPRLSAEARARGSSDARAPHRQLRVFEAIIPPTVAAFDGLAPALLVPAHCTGWKAVHQLAARFPDAFVQSAVGTTVEL
jgi:hypothetical protein